MPNAAKYTMKSALAIAVMMLAVPLALGNSETNPTAKVIELISDLQDTMIKKGEASQAIYSEFAGWCTSRAQELGLELKAGKAEQKDLEAQIADGKATISTKKMKIVDEANDIEVSEAEIKAQWKLRKKEAANFATEEKDLMEVISMLKRAKAVIDKELSGGASLLQTSQIQSVMQVVASMVQASMANNQDAQRLASLIQSSQDESAAPSASAYSSGSSGIVTMLADLLDKADKELEQIRAKEEQAVQNWNMLKSSLSAEIDFSKEDKDEAAKEKSNAKEEKAIDEGDLGLTVKDVQADVKSLADLRRVCIAKVEEFSAMAKSRDEELKALAEAKKVIKEKMSGAGNSVYGAAALFQLRSSSLSQDSVQEQTSNRVLKTIRELATSSQSVELNQLAVRVQMTFRAGADGGENPFAKVVGMISDMIAKLEAEAAENADHEAYCTKELGETKTKKEDRTDSIEELTTKIDQMMSRSKKLKRQVKRLERGLAEIQKSQTEMDKMRQEENSEYLDEKAELDRGLEGVRGALKTLQDYYGRADSSHKQRTGQATAIITLLETCESDFSQSLAELMGGEQTALADYEKQTQDNKVDKESKEAEAEIKTKEYKGLDKEVVNVKSDRTGVESELDAVNDYLAKVMKECSIPVETYAEKKAKREKEIDGLKDALSILESETALLQTNSRALRGVRRA